MTLFEGHKYLRNHVAELEKVMASKPIDYKNAAILMRTIAGRIARYYYVSGIPAYSGKRVDDDMVFFDNTPGKLLKGIKEWRLTDEAEIIDWLEGTIEQGNRVAHPELNKSLNNSLIDTYFINLPKIEKLFVEKFPNDNGLTDELRGTVQIYFQQSFANRYTGEVYPVLKYKAIIENENYQQKNTKCDWIIDGKSEKDWVKDIEPNAKTNMFFLKIRKEYVDKDIKLCFISKGNDGEICSNTIRLDESYNVVYNSLNKGVKNKNISKVNNKKVVSDTPIQQQKTTLVESKKTEIESSEINTNPETLVETKEHIVSEPALKKQKKEPKEIKNDIKLPTDTPDTEINITESEKRKVIVDTPFEEEKTEKKKLNAKKEPEIAFPVMGEEQKSSSENIEEAEKVPENKVGEKSYADTSVNGGKKKFIRMVQLLVGFLLVSLIIGIIVHFGSCFQRNTANEVIENIETTKIPYSFLMRLRAIKEGDENEEWKDNTLIVKDGDTFLIQMEIKNNGEIDAENVKAYVDFKKGVGNIFEITGDLKTSDGNEKICGEKINIASEEPLYLEYVENSAFLTNGKINNIKLSDGIIIPNNGALLGDERIDGIIPSNASEVITLKFVAHKSVISKLSMQVRLKGNKEWEEFVETVVGDEVEFQIEYTNLLNEQADNVMIKDVLPNNLEYVPNSTYLYNAQYPNGTYLDDNEITTEGINIGSYNPEGNGYVRFNAKVIDKDLITGENTLVNWATSTVNYLLSKDDATIIVKK